MLKQQTPPILPSPLNPLSHLILLISPILSSLPILLSPLILPSLHNPPSCPSLPIPPSPLISPTGRKNKQKNAKNNFFIIFAHIQKTRNL